MALTPHPYGCVVSCSVHGAVVIAHPAAAPWMLLGHLAAHHQGA